jgi:hypothetical protein
VIYRDNYHPILEIGGLKHFLVESVVAVIDNKAAVVTREVLRDALESVRSVKQLDRSRDGNNYVVMDFHGGGPKQNSDPPASGPPSSRNTHCRANCSSPRLARTCALATRRYGWTVLCQ